MQHNKSIAPYDKTWQESTVQEHTNARCNGYTPSNTPVGVVPGQKNIFNHSKHASLLHKVRREDPALLLNTVSVTSTGGSCI